MTERFETVLRIVGSLGNPSYAITIPKFLINEKRVDPTKRYDVIIKEVNENERTKRI